MLVAVSAAHGRHAVTRAWAEHTASIGFDAVSIAVTEGDTPNVETCKGYGFIVTECPNEPLAQKFNLAMKYAMTAGATRIMILPSDDFASPEWLHAARTNDADYIIPHTCGIYNAMTGAAYRITKNSLSGQLRFGAGRVVSRRVVNVLCRELWPEHLNKGLDSASNQRIQKAKFTPTVVTVKGVPLTDVKTGENLWPYNTWEGGSDTITADEALHMVSHSVRGQIDALRK